MQFAFLGHSFFGQSILFGHWFTAYTADAVPMHIIAANNIAISLFIPMCFCLFYYSSSFANLVIVCLQIVNTMCSGKKVVSKVCFITYSIIAEGVFLIIIVIVFYFDEKSII